MEVAAAQREVRQVYRGGGIGQCVSGLLWFGAAALASFATPRTAITFLLIGGFFIFPVTTLVLRLLGGPWHLSSANPLKGLAMQVAFVLPLSFPLVAAATLYRHEWFFPAMAVALGAHYLPFTFLYGMPLFAVLSAVLIAGGVGVALAGIGTFGTAAWLAGLVLLVFALLGHVSFRRELAARPADGTT